MLGPLEPLFTLSLGLAWWCAILAGAAVTFHRSRTVRRGGRGKRRNLATYFAAVGVALAAGLFWSTTRSWVTIPVLSPVLLLATPLLVPLMVLGLGFGAFWWAQRKIAQRIPVPAGAAPGAAGDASRGPAAAARSRGPAERIASALGNSPFAQPRPRTFALVWLGATIVLTVTTVALASGAPNLTWLGRPIAFGLEAAADKIPFFRTLALLGSAGASALLVTAAHVGLRLLRTRASEVEAGQ